MPNARHPVSVTCATCGKAFKTTTLKYCPTCRRAYNASRQPKLSVNKQKPQPKPQRQPRHKKPPTNVVESVNNSLAKASNNEMKDDPHFWLTQEEKVEERMMKRSLPARNANRSQNLRNYVASIIDPVETQGSLPPNFDVDNVGEGQLSMTADNSFSFIVSLSGSTVKPVVRIAQVASPVVTHLIYCSLGHTYISVDGAKSFILDNNTIAVIGNKIEYLGNLAAPADFTPKEDYRQCRILSMSDNIQYNGKIIDVNGNTYTAHIQAPLEVTTLSPNQIADSVRAPMTKPITRVSQHKEPVYEYNYVEPNDAPQNGKDKVTMSEMFTFAPSNDVQPSLWQEQAIAVTDAPATAVDYSNMMTTQVTTMLDNSKTQLLSLFTAWFDKVDERYGIYQDNHKTITLDHQRTFDPIAYLIAGGAPEQLTACYASYQAGFYEEEAGGEKFQGDAMISGVQRYLEHIFSAAEIATQMDEWIMAGPTPTLALLAGQTYLGGRLKFTFSFSPRKPLSLRMDDMVPYPSINLETVIIEEETSAFVDAHYKVAVTEFMTDGDINMLVTSRCVYQLILNDKSVLAEQAKRLNVDKTAVTGKQLERISKIIRAIPPALIEGEAKEQLLARGIFSDLSSLLGPVVGTLIPGANAFIQQGGKIIDSFM